MLFFCFFFFCDFSACCCCFLTRSVWAVDDCWPFPTELKRGGHTHNSVFFFFLTYAPCLTSVCFIDSRSLWLIYTIFLFFSFCFFFFAYDLRWHPLSLYIYIYCFCFVHNTALCQRKEIKSEYWNNQIAANPHRSASLSEEADENKARLLFFLFFFQMPVPVHTRRRRKKRNKRKKKKDRKEKWGEKVKGGLVCCQLASPFSIRTKKKKNGKNRDNCKRRNKIWICFNAHLFTEG